MLRFSRNDVAMPSRHATPIGLMLAAVVTVATGSVSVVTLTGSALRSSLFWAR